MSVLVAGVVGAIAGAVVLPAGLTVLGFTAIGPAAASVASMGIGGAGGGALYLWSCAQALAMGGGAAALGAKVGAAVGVVAGLIIK